MIPGHRARSNEQGAVFIIALMVMVMLTAVGLSLALVTETEMLLGGNEQIIMETFYATELAINVVLGQSAAGNLGRQCFAALAKEEGDVDRKVGVRKLGYSIDTTSIYPVAFDVAPYSKANAGRGDILYSGFFQAKVRALRGSWPAAQDVPRNPEEDLATIDFTIQSEKSIEMSFFVSPIQSVLNIGSFDHPAVLGCEPHPAH